MDGKSVLRTTFIFSLFIIAAFASTRFAEKNYEYHGSLYDPFPSAYQFELLNYDGEIFNTADHPGKVMLLFFGYTNCPDVCPTTLADFKRVRGLLEDLAQDVVFVFITVDPERDTSERIGAYVSAFDEHIYGLTGSDEALQLVWDGYYIFQEKEDSLSEASLEYLVSHTSRIYLIDQQGNLRITFPYEMTANEMYLDIMHLLAEAPSE